MRSGRSWVAALLVLPLVVAGCSSSGGSLAAPDSRMPTTSTTASSGAPSPGSDTPSPTSGGEVPGRGLTVRLPDGWREGTPAEKKKAGINEIYVGPQADGFSANVNIVQNTSPGDLDSFVKSQVASLHSDPKYSDVSDPSPRSFGGEDGAEVTGSQMLGQLTIRQRFDVAIHDGTAYIVTFSASADAYDAQQEAGAAILDSLRFT